MAVVEKHGEGPHGAGDGRGLRPAVVAGGVFAARGATAGLPGRDIDTLLGLRARHAGRPPIVGMVALPAAPARAAGRAG